MKVAVVGSRSLTLGNLGDFLPEQVTEIVSGGARGIDACAKEYAKRNRLTYTEFLPEYARYQRSAPLKRNEKIVQYADMVIAFWDGKSKGTKYTIDFCMRSGKKLQIIVK